MNLIFCYKGGPIFGGLTGKELLIELNQICESSKDDKMSIVVAQFHELGTKVFDIKK